MKKTIIILIMSIMLLSSAFSLSLLEKMLLPEYKGDLSSVNYKLIESSDDVWIIEIDGVTYIYRIG